MLAKLKPETVEALLALQHTRDFEIIMAWLRDSLTHTTELALNADDDLVVRRAQGAAKDLSELIKLAEQSQQIMQTMKNSGNR